MENPHEKDQSDALARVISGVSKLNSSIARVNEIQEEVYSRNLNLSVVSEIMQNYQASVDYYLRESGAMKEPFKNDD
ncbi:DASH complex subunit DAD4 [Yarrowia lipolytica]|nr:DASH complex subunit DAD4 [Yarrowia lipolytica]